MATRDIRRGPEKGCPKEMVALLPKGRVKIVWEQLYAT